MKRTLCLIGVLIAVGYTVFGQSKKVLIRTELGEIEIALFDNTPLHRDNMLRLAKEHFFDSTLFHRVIPNFVIQGGDPDSKTAKPGAMLGNGDLGYKLPAEINDSNYHFRGAVGMARDNNPAKESSACQFYIVIGKPYTEPELDMAEKKVGKSIPESHRVTYRTLGGTPTLDNNYTVFGYVTRGMEVVDNIVNLPRNAMDRPDSDIHMIEVKVVKKKKRFLFF